VTSRPSRRRATHSRTTDDHASVVLVDGVARPKITRQEVAVRSLPTPCTQIFRFVVATQPLLVRQGSRRSSQYTLVAMAT